MPVINRQLTYTHKEKKHYVSTDECKGKTYHESQNYMAVADTLVATLFSRSQQWAKDLNRGKKIVFKKV